MVAGLLPASLPAQHVHGVAELGVVVEGSSLGVTFEAPLADVIGFEHAPENDEQIAAIQNAAAMLGDPANLFGTPAAAGCALSRQSIAAPGYFTDPMDDHDASDHGEEDDHDHEDHDSHDHDDHDGDHAEAAAHDDHEDHDHDDEGHGASHHSNLLASYEWNCTDVTKLDSLSLSIAAKLASVETINVQVLTPTGVSAEEMSGSTASISLTPQ